MATLHVRNVPDDLYERLRHRAATKHRSLSAEIIALPEGYAADLIREGRGEIEPR